MFPILDMRTWGEGEARLGNAFIAAREMVIHAFVDNAGEDDAVTRKYLLRDSIRETCIPFLMVPIRACWRHKMMLPKLRHVYCALSEVVRVVCWRQDGRGGVRTGNNGEERDTRKPGLRTKETTALFCWFMSHMQCQSCVCNALQ